MEPLLFVVYVALGVFVGFLAGLLGIGGGMTIVPVLVAVFTREGFALEHVLPLSIGTASATIMFTAISSARAHHGHGAVDWGIVRVMAPGLIVGSLVGPQIASAMPARAMAAAFAVFTWFTAFRLIRRAEARATRELPVGAGLFGVGAGIGVLSGALGVGGAFLSVPFMVRCRVRMHAAVATSAALGIPIAIAATIGFVYAGLRKSGLPAHAIGYVYLPALAGIVVSSMIAAPFGARLAHRWRGATLRRAFAVLMSVLGCYMLWRALGG
ncbi:hypothetical protein BURK1_03049 [Burkholderiales bacterium]|nr:hypothetical protein BURK1_03049 [Burkholderiales bacterium]